MSKGKVETSLRFFSAQQSGQKVRSLPKLRSYQVHPTSKSVVKKSQRVQTLRAESTQSPKAVDMLELCHVGTGERLRGTSGVMCALWRKIYGAELATLKPSLSQP